MARTENIIEVILVFFCFIKYKEIYENQCLLSFSKFVDKVNDRFVHIVEATSHLLFSFSWNL